MDKRYQVFVSSTYNDLVNERKEATQAILKCDCFPAGMELFPATNKKQWSVIKQVIDDSDFYLLIIAGRYGSLGIDDSGKKVGYTEMEFDYALSQGKPIIAMLHRSPENLSAKLTEKTEVNIKRLEKFRDKAMSGRMVAFWENKDQLNSEILNSLHKMISSTPEAVGWIKADTISRENNAENSKPLLIMEGLKAIDNVEDKINYLQEYQYKELRECFEDKKFIKEFADFININQSSDIICNAIELLPVSMDYKAKRLLTNMLDLKSLFFAQCKDGKIQGTKLSDAIVELLIFLEEYSLDYSEPVLNFLKAGNFSPDQKSRYMRYISNSRCYFDQKKRKSLVEYIVQEMVNTHRLLSINDLCHLLVSTCYTEDAFVEVYNVFINNDKVIQREIINNIFQYCGSDMDISTPRILRMFFDMSEKVLSWDDDRIKVDWLLYCLFTRTYDIFTVDEVCSKVQEFNDDVFYMFFWKLGYGEFGWGAEEGYDLDDEEKHRITQIIENRHHPRGKKLLEHLG
ncbi:MAG: DUF4062 domain-containing protein [Clostridium sp.]|nr:DUF4062 domain-containing protein [Clostridium sp.]